MRCAGNDGKTITIYLRKGVKWSDGVPMTADDFMFWYNDIWKIIIGETWSIGVVGQSPAVMGVRLVKNNMGNIPARQANAQHARTPLSSQPSTFFFK